jgi:hypothetical protein
MKIKNFTLAAVAVSVMAFIFYSCSPITLTSWKNPKENQKVSHIVIWGMFNKIEYEKPFEQAVAGYFNQKKLKAVEANTILTFGEKYELTTLEKKFDSIGADGILIVTYTGTDKTRDYVPASATIYPDYYYSYYGFYSWGYPMWGPGYSVTTGGYWTTTTVVNLRANLYDNSDNTLLWTAQIAVTDPQYVDEASYGVAEKIYSDWLNNQLISRK